MRAPGTWLRCLRRNHERKDRRGRPGYACPTIGSLGGTLPVPRPEIEPARLIRGEAQAGGKDEPLAAGRRVFRMRPAQRGVGAGRRLEADRRDDAATVDLEDDLLPLP